MPSETPARNFRGIRLLGATLVAMAGVLFIEPSAWAHVTVAPNTASPGEYAKESFRVPNERNDASTVQLEVSFPTDHPLAAVAVEPVPGWTATVLKQKLPTPVKTDDGMVTEAVSSIVWKGGSVEPGQFQEFPVSLGPVPNGTDKLVFKALQTYSDGEVVHWIDVPQDGAPEPDHPAPVLSLKAASSPTAPEVGVDWVGRTLGGAGLLAGLAAFGLALAGRRRRGTGIPAQVPVEKVAKTKVRS